MKRILLAILIFIPGALWAAEQPIWVEAEGVSYMGDADTFKETADRALHDAMRNAAENAAGVFIKSHTYVSNSQIEEDLVYAFVKGKILKYDIVSEGWDPNSKQLYKTKIKALVAPDFRNQKPGLAAQVSLSRYELKPDDEIRIYYQTNQDAYVHIFSVAADGSVTLLLPNCENRDNFTRAGKVYEFPPAGSRLILRARFLPGCTDAAAEERVKIIATSDNEELLTLGFKQGMFEVYDARSTGMISDLVRKLNRMDPENWTEATTTYKLVR